MPSSGGYPDHGRPPGEEPLRGYGRLLALAAHLKVRDVVFFAGWGTGGDEEEMVDVGLLRHGEASGPRMNEDTLDALDRAAVGK